MKRRAFVVSAAGAVFANSIARADEVVVIQPPLEGVKPNCFDVPRIGDVMADFALPGPDGQLWRLSAQRGKTPVILVLSAEAPILVAERSTPAQALLAIVRAAAELKKTDVTTALISTAIGINFGAQNQYLQLLGLHDAQAAMARLFKVSQTAFTVVAIDRAGFLRRIEAVRDLADVAPLLLKIGDCTPQIEVGKAAPDFSLVDMNGHMRRLADLRGQKNLVLTFFPKCFTGGCANQLTSLRAERDIFDDTSTQIWAVSTDPARDLDPTTGQDRGQIAFASSLGLPFPLLPDTERHLCLLYDTVQNVQQVSERWTFLIDRDGILRFIDKNVQTRVLSHGPDLLARMRELGMVR